MTRPRARRLARIVRNPLLRVESLEDRWLPNGTAFGFALDIGGPGATVTDTVNASDPSGDVYVTGNFRGSINFDATHSLTSSGGGNNAFVAKYSSTGTCLWADVLGSGSTSTGSEGHVIAIAVDGAGNVYTTGGFIGTGSFSGTGTGDDLTSVTNDNSENIYVSKLSATGAFVWADVLGDGSNNVWAGGNAITVDGSQNVYVTGFIKGTGSFSGTGSGDDITTPSVGTDYVVKLNAAGGNVWVDELGVGAPTEGAAIAVDGSGNVFTTGTFAGTGSFSGTGSGDNLSSESGPGNLGGSAFVSKLSSTGGYVWAKVLDTGTDSGVEVGNLGLAVDSAGNVYSTGTFNGTASFSGTGSGDVLTAPSTGAAYVSKLSANGSFVWAHVLGGGSGSNGTQTDGLAIDTAGDVYTAGFFKGTGSFSGTGSGGSLSTGSTGTPNAYVVKLNTAGNFVWADDLGAGGSAYAYGIALDGSGSVYTAGYFSGTGAFSGTGSGDSLTSVGVDDGFISKLTQTGPVLTTSTSNLPSTAGTLTIDGVGFDPTGVNAVTLSSGTATVTAATSTSITLGFTTAPTAGPLTAIVATDGVSSGSPVQVATVVPVATGTSSTIGAGTTTVTIGGTGFDPTGTNTVVLSSGAATVTSVTATSITITFTTAPTAGTLTAVVVTDGVSSSPVQVATVLPVIAESSSGVAADSATLTITGVGFDPSGTNTVGLSSGAATVTAATPTSLTLTFTAAPTAGALTALVSVDGASGSSPVQVATVTPVVNVNTAGLAANASSLTISGAGFGPPGNTTVTLSSGAGTVTSATSTSITVAFTAAPAPGALTVSVTTDGVSSGSPVQVATIVPAVVLGPSTLPGGEVGVGYNQSITASGGSGAVTLVVSGITNPTGLTISGSGTGTILVGGTPTAGGTVTFTVTPTDDLGTGAPTAYSFTVSPAVVLTPSALPAGTVGTAYHQTITFSGGAGAVTLVASAVVTTTGVTVTGSGTGTITISGTPSSAGTISFLVTPTDRFKTGSGTAYSVAIAAPTSPPGAVVLIGSAQYAVGADTGGGQVTLYNPDGSVRYTATPFPGFAGGVRVATADFNGDGIADLIAGTGPGGPTHVAILDGVDQHVLFSIDPFEASFTGGVYVAAGDLTGDGTPDLVITPDEGGGPRCRVFDGKTWGQIVDFYGISDPNFRGGARAAIADVAGKGYGDLIVAAGFGGGPRVAGFDGKSLASGDPQRVFADFYAFEQTLRNGVFIAAGDINGDGFADVVAGGGPGGGPRVFALSGKDLVNGNQQVQLANFFGGDPNSRGGIRVAVKNLDGDNRGDIVVGVGSGAGSQVTAYLGKNTPSDGLPATAEQFDAFSGFTGGVFVG